MESVCVCVKEKENEGREGERAKSKLKYLDFLSVVTTVNSNIGAYTY